MVDDAELESAAEALAGSIAAPPPIAVRLARKAVDAALGQTVREGLRLAAGAQAECLRSADFEEATKAASERRPPEYHNR